MTRIVRKVALGCSIFLLLVIPAVPLIYRWLYPPAKANDEPGFWGFVAWGLSILNSLSDGITILLWMAGCAASAALASLIAVGAAWIGRETHWTIWLCAAPALLVLGSVAVFYVV